jgi:hypothetical protein
MRRFNRWRLLAAAFLQSIILLDMTSSAISVLRSQN